VKDHVSTPPYPHAFVKNVKCQCEALIFCIDMGYEENVPMLNTLPQW